MARVSAKMLKDFAEMYAKKGCNIHATCEAMKISRMTYYRWREKSQAFCERLDAVREAQRDWGESKLIEAIDKGDIPSLHFFLRTQCRDRGYDTTQNVKLSGTVKTQQITKEDVEDKIKKVIALNKAQETELSEEELLKEIEADD